MPRQAAADGKIFLLGHFAAGIGLGTAARGTEAALAAAGLPPVTIDLDRLGGQLPAGDPPGERPVTLVHTNPDLLLALLSRPEGSHLQSFFDHRYTIGLWAWESTTTVPDAWLATLPLFDEIWVPSRFTADGLGPRLPCPVLVMPHVVEPPAPVASRTQLGLPAEGHLFLCCFDELSNLNRKNPLGAIQAFHRAFAASTEDTAGLILKARSLSEPARRFIAAAMGGHPRIRLTEGEIAAGHLSALVAGCDSFVSLHRAEGFGLAIAEAMYFGKPAIVTGHSGNLDFTRGSNALLVRHRRVRLAEPDGHYPAGTEWADPDLEQAARLMRLLVANPGRAARLGARAAADMRAEFSAAAVGRRMAARLATIRHFWRKPPRRQVRRELS